jgi:dipeptidyl aminopeptidase/acylaminoacyl peptidase
MQIAWIGLLGLLSTGAALPQAVSPPREEFVYEIPAGIEIKDGVIVVSEDGSRFGFAGKIKGAKVKGAKDQLVLDGRVVSEWDEAFPPAFSRDGRRVVTAGVRGGVLVMQLDGGDVPLEPGTNISEPPVFSPDGKRLAYPVRRAAAEFVVVDGNGGPAFNWVGKPAFSGDSRHVAYAAKPDNKQFMIVTDGERGATFTHLISGPVFSADGRLAYAAAPGRALVVTVDSQPYAEVPLQRGKVSGIESIVFSPDGKRLAFIVVRGGAFSYSQGKAQKAQRTVMVDGKQGKVYDVSGLSGLQFSADGRHLAYAVHDQGKRQAFVVLDGLECPQYSEVLQDSISFSAMTMTYWVRQGNRLSRVIHDLH